MSPGLSGSVCNALVRTNDDGKIKHPQSSESSSPGTEFWMYYMRAFNLFVISRLVIRSPRFNSKASSSKRLEESLENETHNNSSINNPPGIIFVKAHFLVQKNVKLLNASNSRNLPIKTSTVHSNKTKKKLKFNLPGKSKKLLENKSSKFSRGAVWTLFKTKFRSDSNLVQKQLSKLLSPRRRELRVGKANEKQNSHKIQPFKSSDNNFKRPFSPQKKHSISTRHELVIYEIFRVFRDIKNIYYSGTKFIHNPKNKRITSSHENPNNSTDGPFLLTDSNEDTEPPPTKDVITHGKPDNKKTPDDDEYCTLLKEKNKTLPPPIHETSDEPSDDKEKDAGLAHEELYCNKLDSQGPPNGYISHCIEHIKREFEYDTQRTTLFDSKISKNLNKVHTSDKSYHDKVDPSSLNSERLKAILSPPPRISIIPKRSSSFPCRIRHPESHLPVNSSLCRIDSLPSSPTSPLSSSHSQSSLSIHSTLSTCPSHSNPFSSLISPSLTTVFAPSASAGSPRKTSHPPITHAKPVVFTDKYGFFVSSNVVSSSLNAKIKKNPPAYMFHSRYRNNETAWESLVAVWDDVESRGKKDDVHGSWPKSKLSSMLFTRSKRMGNLCKAGVPDRLRGKVWYKLANCEATKVAGLYDELLAKCQDPSLKTQMFDVIERDITRCYPQHTMFADKYSTGQTNLRNVLKAYALHKPEVGYCQGMGMLVGAMLMYLSPEDSFWLLVQTISVHLEDYYTPGLSQLKVDAEVFDGLLKKIDNKVYKHFKNQGVISLMYITKWFLTMYTTSLPWEIVLRIWDLFYAEGVKSLFRIGLAVIRLNSTYLLENCPTNSEILSFLLNIPSDNVVPHRLIECALNIKLKRKNIQKLRNYRNVPNTVLPSSLLPIK